MTDTPPCLGSTDGTASAYYLYEGVYRLTSAEHYPLALISRAQERTRGLSSTAPYASVRTLGGWVTSCDTQRGIRKCVYI